MKSRNDSSSSTGLVVLSSHCSSASGGSAAPGRIIGLRQHQQALARPPVGIVGGHAPGSRIRAVNSEKTGVARVTTACGASRAQPVQQFRGAVAEEDLRLVESP